MMYYIDVDLNPYTDEYLEEFSFPNVIQYSSNVGEIDYENENVFGFEKPNNLLGIVEENTSLNSSNISSISSTNNINDAELLIIGNEVLGTTENSIINGEEISFDLDTYSVELEAGHNYTFAWGLNGQTLPDYTEIQSFLYLWDANGDEIDNSGLQDETGNTTFFISESGTYYLNFHSYGHTGAAYNIYSSNVFNYEEEYTFMAYQLK